MVVKLGDKWDLLMGGVKVTLMVWSWVPLKDSVMGQMTVVWKAMTMVVATDSIEEDLMEN